MQLSKQRILESYYRLTLPLRAVRNAMLVRRGKTPICVGTFHRIADDGANAWTTSRVEFRAAIEWLQARFEMVSLREAQCRMAATENRRPTFALTFDDGYAVNGDWALPWLLERGVPFTYFVTSDPTLHGGTFPHDAAMGKQFAAHTVEQLRELADEELVEIGAHTRSHANLGAIDDPIELHDEVILSSQQLEQALGCHIEQFAFPFGQHVNLNTTVFEMLAEHGFTAICSAYGGYNFPGDDPLHVQRMCCDGPAIKTKNWASLDPYKQWRIPRYDYRDVSSLEQQLAGAGT